MNSKKSRYCPLPWNHLSVLGSGRIRLCCHDDQNIPYLKESGRSGFLRELRNPQDRLDHLDLIKVQTEIERGEIPPRCHHCFDLEKDGLDSPRLEYLERFARDETNSLRYFDITLDNTCNLKCRMCTPKYSAGIAKDFEAIGIPPSR